MLFTLKGKILLIVALVMVAGTLVNIYFTNRDVGDAMLQAQEESATNILHSLDLIIKGDYHNLLLDKRIMTLEKREQLKNVTSMIMSVFSSFCGSVENGLPLPENKAIQNSLAWLDSAPFTGVDHYIFDSESHIVTSSNMSLTNEIYQGLEDVKKRNISEVMRFDNLPEQGDYATFSFVIEETENRTVLAYFRPFEPWGYTVAASIDISDIVVEAKQKQDKIIDSIANFATQLSIAESGFVYLFTAEDQVLVPAEEPQEVPLKESTNLLTGTTIHEDIMVASQAGGLEVRFVASGDEQQRAMIAYSSYFKPLQWFISVIVPVKEINLPAQQLVVRQIIIIGIVFMLGLLAIVALVTRIAKPLNLLSTYARELPSLDFTKPLDHKTLIDHLPETYRDEVGELASSFLLMRQELNNNITELVTIETAKQKMESELTIAREIQLGMVPKTFPSFPEYEEFDLFATLIPAREIGGDLYDFFLLKDNRLCFALGDVSDKGIPSALLMVVTRTLIRTIAENTDSPSAILHNVNNALSADNPRSMFVSLVIGMIDIKSGEIIYANGGHNPPVVMHRVGTSHFCEGTNDPLVGVLPNMPYSDLSVTLEPGDSFFLYTDGVNEAMNCEEEQFTNTKLLQILEARKEQSSSDIVGAVLEQLAEHTDGAPQSDDIAMLTIKYLGHD